MQSRDEGEKCRGEVILACGTASANASLSSACAHKHQKLCSSKQQGCCSPDDGAWHRGGERGGGAQEEGLRLVLAVAQRLLKQKGQLQRQRQGEGACPGRRRERGFLREEGEGGGAGEQTWLEQNVEPAQSAKKV